MLPGKAVFVFYNLTFRIAPSLSLTLHYNREDALQALMGLEGQAHKSVQAET